MQKKTGQEKNSWRPHLEYMYLSKKKSESRSKRKDKAARSLDEKEHHPAFEASRIFFINNI
jgi:hypothetical protein